VGPIPYEFWIGRLCEEFQCRPSEMVAELRRSPVGLLETIVEYRAYARAKAIYERACETARSRADVPRGDLFDDVAAIEFELVNEALTQDANG
jgi:hypothetical protein